MTFLVQQAMQEAAEHGHLITAGWLILGVTLLLWVVGMSIAMYQREKFRYWRMITIGLVLGLAAMSGLLDEVLKIIAKGIGAG